jgi:aminopeptidase N
VKLGKQILPLILLSMLTWQYSAQTCQQTKCKHKHHSFEKNSATDNLRSDTIDVLNYSIDLDFTSASSQHISGNCQVNFETKLNGVNSISLDLLQMNIDSIKQGNFISTYSYNDTLLVVALQTSLNAAALDSVIVYYNGSPQGDPSNWGGFYFQGNYAYNLGVGFGANPHNYGRVWHPCFDNFVERATYDITITTLSSHRGYANGLIVNETDNGSTHTTEWSLSQSIPTYLACVAAGNYTHVSQTYPSALQSTNIPVQLIAESSDTNNFKSSFINLFGAMSTFETQYGPYLWDKVGFHLVPFSSGAMEHATSIAYPLATINDTTTYETLMAHELSHHWWGDLVTCRTAEDMWINEGMAAYSERIFLEGIYGYDTYLDDIKNNHKDVLLNAHIRDTGYYALHGVPHNITYGDHSYNKGADVAHTLRGYMGDNEFFDGLHSFLVANEFQDVDAFDFRDHLTANTNVDVTDFFNDWVLNPGFPAFVIDSFQVVPNGGNFDIEIFVHQKLKGTSQFFSNVPMGITLMDEDWNEMSSNVVLDGEFSQVTVSSSFVPSMLYLNGNNKISQAVTGENNIITSTGIKDLSYPLFRFTTDNPGVDSSLVRIEHYWVAPDEFKEPINEWSYYISNERFWNVDGIFSNGFEAEGRVFFNARTTVGGNLDNELCGLSGFHEDSLKILYRPNAGEEWTEFPNITIANLGSETDGYGFISFENMQKGQYTFGWRKSAVSVDEVAKKEVLLMLYPNPTENWLSVDVNLDFGHNRMVQIIDAAGKVVFNKPFWAKQLNVADLSTGTYFLSIVENGKTLIQSSFIKE